MRLLFYVFLLLLFACNTQNPVDLEAEKAKILELHRLQRDYHFQKDSVAFAELFSDDFMSVNRGQITQPSREASIARYHAYFSSVDFVKWDDVSEPVIRLSEDGKMAYTIVDKIVRVSYADDNGEIVEGETHFAWTAIYKKIGDNWKIDCVSSTEQAEG